jgi:hypothetical protein
MPPAIGGEVCIVLRWLNIFYKVESLQTHHGLLKTRTKRRNFDVRPNRSLSF